MQLSRGIGLVDVIGSIHGTTLIVATFWIRKETNMLNLWMDNGAIQKELTPLPMSKNMNVQMRQTYVGGGKYRLQVDADGVTVFETDRGADLSRKISVYACWFFKGPAKAYVRNVVYKKETGNRCNCVY